MTNKQIQQWVIDIQLSNYLPGECPLCNKRFETIESLKSEKTRFFGSVNNKQLYIFFCEECWEEVKVNVLENYFE